MRELCACLDRCVHTCSIQAQPAATQPSRGRSACTGHMTLDAERSPTWAAADSRILKPTLFPSAHTCSVFVGVREGDADAPRPCHKHYNNKRGIFFYFLAKRVLTECLEFCCWSLSLPGAAEDELSVSKADGTSRSLGTGHLGAEGLCTDLTPSPPPHTQRRTHEASHTHRQCTPNGTQ